MSLVYLHLFAKCKCSNNRCVFRVSIIATSCGVVCGKLFRNVYKICIPPFLATVLQTVNQQTLTSNIKDQIIMLEFCCCCCWSCFVYFFEEFLCLRLGRLHANRSGQNSFLQKNQAIPLKGIQICLSFLHHRCCLLVSLNFYQFLVMKSAIDKCKLIVCSGPGLRSLFEKKKKSRKYIS